jgi:hypothetical protein
LSFQRNDSVFFPFLTPEQLLSALWGENEKPIYMEKTSYKLSSMRENATGFVMLTDSALYIFKAPTFKKASLRLHFSFFQCSRIIHSEDKLEFEFPPLLRKTGDAAPDAADESIQLPLPIDETAFGGLDSAALAPQWAYDPSNAPRDRPSKRGDRISIGTEYVRPTKIKRSSEEKVLTILTGAAKLVFKQIVHHIQLICKGVANCRIPELYSPAVTVGEQPKSKPLHLLKRRISVIAHYVFSRGTGLDFIEYFDTRWGGEPSLILGSKFHPGVYAGVVGCAIGWEDQITTVCLKRARFNHLDGFLNGLLRSSQTLTTVIFSDYPIGFEVPVRIVGLTRTTVSSWCLLDCGIGMITNVLSALSTLPTPFESLTIGRHSYNNADALTLFATISNHPYARQLRSLTLSALHLKAFPARPFTDMIGVLESIQTLELSQIDIDGGPLFESVCAGAPRIRILSLHHTTFATELSAAVATPPLLASLDVSDCHFVGPALFSFFSAITQRDVAHPFFLSARSLALTDDSFPNGRSFAAAKCTVLEFDFSGNHMDGHCREFIRGFVASQRRLRHITVNRVTTDDALSLSFALDRAMRMEHMAGIDVEELPEAGFYGMLIPALQGARALRRLSVRGARARERGIRALENLLGSGSATLVELQADGMGPRRGHRAEPGGETDEEALLTLWDRIGASESLVANDFPVGDLGEVRMSVTDAVRARAGIGRAKRREVTTAEERLGLLIKAVDSGNEAEIAVAESGMVYAMVHVDKGVARESIPVKALEELSGGGSDSGFGGGSDDGDASLSAGMPSDDGLPSDSL